MATEACPCGYLGDAAGKCRCTMDQIQRYRLRISGPLLDRLDMHVEVPRVPASVLQTQQDSAETSEQVAARVRIARELQWQRQGKCNARLSAAEVEQYCRTDATAEALLLRAMQKFSLSARAYHRILKVARSIADLDGREALTQAHISEAIALRRLDRGQ
jgi:magnesium chelatase family protein